MTVAVIVPCFNTSDACAPVLRAALHVADAVLAIDDGSNDDTFEHIRASGAAYLRLTPNQGKGAALRAGIAAIVSGRQGPLGRAFDCIVTIDGDGQHDPADIPRLVATAQSSGADFVIGVRNVRLMPSKSKIGNYFSRLLFFLGSGRYIADTQSGFRLLSLPLATALLDTVSWGRYETEAEMLSTAVAMGFRVATVEIPTIYFDGNRRTHFDPLWDSMRVVAVLSRYALTSLAVTAIDLVTFMWLTSRGRDVVTANLVARAFAVVGHFLLSRNYAFRIQAGFKPVELIRYVLAVGLNLWLTTWLILTLRAHGVDVIEAKLVAQLLGFVLTFLVLQRFVFPRGSSGKTDWDRYYQRPVSTARWSRRVMSDELARLFTRFAPRREPLSVLEIGGGNSCFLPRLMKELRISPYAILDSSTEGMRRAREQFEPLYGGQIDYLLGDAFTVSPSRTYDVVFSIGLLEHFDEQEAIDLVALHRRWVEPGGLVVISVPTPTVPYRLTRFVAELFGVWHFPDERPVTRERLEKWLDANGLEVVSARILWAQVLTQLVVGARRRDDGRV